MAKDTISQYSKTAGSNTDVQSVSIAEGMAPSDVNNAIRELMVDLASLCDGTQSLTTLDVTGDITSGTLNADGDTSAGDNAAVGYTAGEGLILTGQGSTNDITIKNDADADVITIATGGTDVEISTGNLVIGTSGKGIDFSATADATGMASELLDDYEEGYLTATLSGNTSGNFVMDSATLAYTKVGRVVHLQGFISTLSDSSTSGQITMNLPFTTASLTQDADNHKFMIHMDNHGDAGIENPYLTISSGQAVAWFANVTDAGTSEGIDQTRVDAAWRTNINLTYIAA